MAFQRPLIMQPQSGDTDLTYSGQQLRQMYDALFVNEGVVNYADLKVVQRGAGANFSVDVGTGFCTILGDDVTNQGKYVCKSDTVANVVVPAPPGSGSRTHRIVARVKDKRHNGSWAANQYEWTAELLEDTGSGTPATPASAISLALVGPVVPSTPNITNSLITDQRQLSRQLSTSPPLFATPAERDIAIPTPTQGLMASVTSTAELYLYDGTTWISAMPRTKRKTADEVVTSSTAFQNDNHILFPAEANSFYCGPMVLFYTAGTTGNLKVQFTGPASFSYRMAVVSHDTSTAGLTGPLFIDTANTAALNAGGLGVGQMVQAVYWLAFQTSSTAGTFTLQWAQTTSDANSTTVASHSYMQLWKTP